MKKLLLTLVLMLVATSAIALEKTSNQPLKLFITKVKNNHSAFKRFKAMEQKADAKAQSIGAYLYNPEISFGGENQENADDTREYGISQTLDITGKNFVQKRVGKYSAISEKANISQLKSNYIAGLIKAIASYESANITIKLAKEQAELMSRFVEISEKRGKAGDVGSTEVSLARLAGAQAQSILADANAILESTKANLKVLCGCNIKNTPVIYGEPPIISDPVNKEKLAITLPLYISAQSADEAAKQNVSFTRRSRMPDPTFSIGKGTEGENDLITFGVSIPMPIFNTGSPEVRVASAEYIQSSADLQKVKTRLLADLNSKFKVYKGHTKALSSWRKFAQPSLNEYTNVLEKQWNAGEISASDYLLQVKQGIETAMTGAEIKSRAWGAWADWMALTANIESWSNYTNKNSKEIK